MFKFRPGLSLFEIGAINGYLGLSTAISFYPTTYFYWIMENAPLWKLVEIRKYILSRNFISQ